VTDQPAAPAERPIPVFTIMALCFLGQSALTIYLPAAPTMTQVFNSTPGRVQLLITAFMTAYALFLPFLGPLSDRLGRRPMILGGAVLFALASLLAAAAPGIEVMYAARALQGIGACCCMVLPRAMIRDLGTGPAASRALTYTGIALTLANIIAPTIGSFLYGWFGWQGSFLFEAVAAAATFAAAWRLPETATGGGVAGKMVASYLKLFTIREHVANSLSFALTSAGYFVWISASPAVFITTLGMSEREYAMVPMFYGIGFLTSGMFAARRLSRVPHNPVIMTGILLNIGAALTMTAMVLGGVTWPALLASPILVVGFGNGLCLPRNMNVALVSAPVEIAGAASAMLMFSQYVIGNLATIIGSLMPYDSLLPLALTQVTWLTLGLLAYLPVAPFWRRQ
jgi:DHA1 family bicyclomycin/chloramphenicol resistance-like MFS transporter